MTAESTFWDRRRAAVKAEEEAAAASQLPDALEEQEITDKTDAEILAELGLPDPDTMNKGDDFAAFMMRAVPEHIRKRALRKLWRSNPVLACVDGLNDYDDDYLAGSYGNAPLKTSYQVGKGLLTHVLEMADQAAAETETGSANTLDKEEELVECCAEEDPAQAAGAVVEEQADEPEFPAPRRMVFRFDEGSA